MSNAWWLPLRHFNLFKFLKMEPEAEEDYAISNELEIEDCESSPHPHEAPLFDLIYNSASKFLSNVIKDKEKGDKDSPDTPSSFYSFLQGLASGTPSTSPAIPKQVEEDIPRPSLFDDSELQEFDFAIDQSIIDSQKKAEVRYTPIAKPEIEYAAEILDHKLSELVLLV